MTCVKFYAKYVTNQLHQTNLKNQLHQTIFRIIKRTEPRYLNKDVKNQLNQNVFSYCKTHKAQISTLKLFVSFDIFFGVDIWKKFCRSSAGISVSHAFITPFVTEDADFLARFYLAKISLRTPEVLHSMLKLQRPIDIEISDISVI